MPITLPATDPAALYYRPLSMGRVVLIENSSLPWAVTLTRRYAKRKRIPLANIVSLALGTGANIDPTSNALLASALIAPVAAAALACSAMAIITGPGCPRTMTWRNDIYNGLPNATGLADFVTTMANAPEINAMVLAGKTLGWAAVGGGATLIVPAYVNFLHAYYLFANSANTYSDYALGQGAGPTIPASPDAAWLASYEGLDGEISYLPTQTAIDALGTASNRALVCGRVGFYWGPDAFISGPSPAVETSQTAFTVVENALRYGSGLNPANRYRHRFHVQINNTAQSNGGLTHAYLIQQLQGWGYNVTYSYRNGVAAPQGTYAPASGGAYTEASLNRGEIKDYPYHVMLGDASNTELPAEPYASAWQPSGGGGSLMGPSEGWQYCLNGLARGGGGGLTNREHVTVAIYGGIYALAHCLLRGMSWAEAAYYCMVDFLPMPACGDPLLRPFPV